MVPKKTSLCKLHPDFHIPGDTVGVGEGFDGMSYAAALKKHAVDTIVIFAKCHYGFSYYPTKIGTVHPGLAKNLVEEVAKGAQAHGLDCVCYYSVFLDTCAIENNPSWRLLKTRDGSFTRHKFEPICVNSPYLEELLIPQTLELLEQYPINEMFYDTMTMFEPCYCDACVKKFGGPIPSDTDDNWLDYVRFYHTCYRDFYAKVAQTIHEHHPDVNCTFNWEWSIRHPEEPVPYINRLAGDLFPSGKVSSFYARYLSGTGHPFDYMTGRFMHGLGDWVNNTGVTLQYTTAAALANGGGMYIIDRQLPNGTLEDRAYIAMDTTFSFVNARRDWVADTTPVAEIAVLTTSDHIVGQQLELFPNKDIRAKRLDLFKAIHEMLTENGIHFTFLSEANILKRIHAYKFILLPELHNVSDTLAAALEKFVENGGSVLIIQSDEDAPNPKLAAMAGVSVAGKTPAPYTYVEYSRDGKTDDPFIVRGYHNLVLPQRDTEVLSYIIEPLISESGAFGHGFAPPVKKTAYAAATLHKKGKGTVGYIAAGLLSSFLILKNPDFTKFVLNMADKLLPEPMVKLKTDAPIEMSLMRKDNDLIIHLVNHAGTEFNGYGYNITTNYMPRILDIGLTVKPGSSKNAPTVSVFSTKPSQKEGDGGYSIKISDNGEIDVCGISLDVMESIKVSGYFA